MGLKEDLLHHHSPGNRYVYFPTIKEWQKGAPQEIRGAENPHALYIHLPFCEGLCTFCGCNIRISQLKEDHLNYLKALKREWALLKESSTHHELTKSFTNIDSLFLGGGTPSVFHPDALEELTLWIKNEFNPIGGQTEASPQSFNENFARNCQQMGINRFSFGVQDFNEDILQNVNRHQSFQEVQDAIRLAKEFGLAGIDLIWGLPHQSEESIKQWRPFLRDLDLDWISFYPLAKVSWLETYQSAFGDFTLPPLKEKYALYQVGVELMEDLGMIHFGFGHFIHKNSPLYQSLKEESLYRYVTGLSPKKLNSLLGLGVGAISHLGDTHTQNEKILDKYLSLTLKAGKLPLTKHHQLNKKEIRFLNEVSLLMRENLLPESWSPLLNNEEKKMWLNKESLSLSTYGRHFLKNILQRAQSFYFS